MHKINKFNILGAIFIVLALRCARGTEKPAQKVVAKFGCVSEIEQPAAYCEAESFYELHTLIDDKMLVYCVLQNNFYDTIFIPIYKVNCLDKPLIKASDIENYESVDGKYEFSSSISIYTSQADSTIKLLKHQRLITYLWADCPDRDDFKGHIFRIGLNCDSLGVEKSLILSYANFDTIIPVRTVEYSTYLD